MEIIINGLSLGSVYALIALGYTMVYGIAKMLNCAQGDIIMVGAYTVYPTLALSGLALPAAVCAVIVCILLGIATEKVAYRPLRGASPLAVLITAIGVSYFLQSIAQLVYDAKSRPISLNTYGSVALFGTKVTVSSLLTLGCSVVIMIALTLFINKARVGRAMLAVSEDRGAAQLMGINSNFIITLTFAIGSALAAVASVFYLMQIPSVTPTLGSMPGIKAFTAAVIGGIGSIPGAMLGGLFLGIVEQICQSIAPISPYTTAIEFALLIVILLLKPTGLLGKMRREKV
ncbi:MAG: branched-chain amino acid ABC transporter permease [Clostridia bacterium]|nr:branched-chain amino acid ABC transporter permease [Clostridia bacterium]